MIKTNVLIVEDEVIIALEIKKVLLDLDFEVSNMVSTYEDVIACITDDEPDIILIDINLHNSSKNGIEIVQEVKKIRNIPCVYITAYSDDKTIEKAILTNPIGYLLKPFNREELKSTILLGLYKIKHSNNLITYKNCLHIGLGYYFDLKNKNLYYKNRLIKLTIKEKKLLKMLIDANGSVLTFEEVEHILWPNNPVSNSALRTLLYRLRSKFDYKIIDTIPSFGCRILIKA